MTAQVFALHKRFTLSTSTHTVELLTSAKRTVAPASAAAEAVLIQDIDGTTTSFFLEEDGKEEEEEEEEEEEDIAARTATSKPCVAFPIAIECLLPTNLVNSDSKLSTSDPHEGALFERTLRTASLSSSP
jgi:hypothetical protein